ncbi:hypothetical protein, partial [Bradyrhizobium retamae]|uniref:hypothetical protein n=1 Tax=Bradyrhizobium retamae TaxID=1300035 RepID=UPI001AECE8F5
MQTPKYKETASVDIIAAFFSLRHWTNLKRSGREAAYVGYSPVIGFDADKILEDLPSLYEGLVCQEVFRDQHF